MRRLELLTAFSLLLAACSGGGGGATGGAGGGGSSGRGGSGGGAGAGGMAVDGAAGASGGGGNGGSAGGTAGGGAGGGGASGGSAGTGGTADASFAAGVDGGASDASGIPGLDGAAGAQPIDGGGTILSLTISTNDVVFDSTRKVLYASLNASVDAGAGVITIDPASGAVIGTLPLGGLTSALAINDDGSGLYVGINTPMAGPLGGADSVIRVDLASKTAGPPVSLGPAKLVVGQIAAVPGSPTQYVVSRRQPGFQSDYAGLALFDGNTQLAQLDSFYGSGATIAFIDHSTLVGCSHLLAPSELDRYAITSTAITPGTYIKDVITPARTRIAVGSGWIFASDGNALNAATLSPLGKYGKGMIRGDSTTAPVIDPDGANVWFLGSANASTALLAFGRTTFDLRRTVSLPSDLSSASPLVRWSPTGFALRTYEKITLVNLPN